MADTAFLSNVVFRMSSGELAGEIRLKPEAWRILTQVNGLRSIGDIAKSIEMDEVTATNIADSLQKAGILEVVAGSGPALRATVNGTFFERLGQELAWAMGPLAEIIINEEMNALGESRDEFPRERIAELVERVSEAVGDENDRIKFQRIMLDLIRTI